MIAIVGAVCVTTLLVLLARFSAGEGPVYKGRHLSEWTEAWGRISQGIGGSDASLSEAEVRAAVAEAGTNAVPYFIKWIQYEESNRRWKAREKLLYFMSDHRARQLTLSSAFYRAGGSTLALSSLSTNLGPDHLAQLALMLNKTNCPQTVGRIAYVLSTQGDFGAEQLALVLRQSNPSTRLSALQFLKAMHSRGELNLPAKALVPGLVQIVADTNGLPAGALKAANRFLSDLNVAPDQSEAMLVDLLSDTDLSIRTSTTNALQMIAPEALTNAQSGPITNSK